MISRIFGTVAGALLLVFVLSNQASAVTVYSRSDGISWSYTNGGVNCGCVPGQNDDIFVNHNITLAGPFTVNTGSLTVATGVTLTVTGDLTFNNNSTIVTNGSLYVTGNFENKNNSRDVDFNGSVRVDGTFKNGSGAIIDFGPGGSISIGGACTNNGSVTQGGNTYTTCTTGPLPVKLISFEAEQAGSDIVLTWATASEQNFQYFSVERTGKQMDWVEVGKVEGSGNSQIRMDYTLTDKTVMMTGHIYYRLKAIDFDGKYEYFPIVTVNYQAPKAWFVSPNPTSNGEIVIMRNFVDDNPVAATLYSMSGAKILEEEFMFTSNTYILTARPNPGLYILKLKEYNGTRYLRVVVE